jgi:hypothetical protein
MRWAQLLRFGRGKRFTDHDIGTDPLGDPAVGGTELAQLATEAISQQLPLRPLFGMLVLPACPTRSSARPPMPHNCEFTAERTSDIFVHKHPKVLGRVSRSAADCGLARKTRHVRVRAALC